QTLRITVENQTYCGHFRPLKEFLPVWETEYASHMSFEEYLNFRVIPSATPENLGYIKSVLKDNIRFLTDDERSNFQVSFVGQHLHTSNSVLVEWNESLNSCSVHEFFENKPMSAQSCTGVPSG